MRGHNLTYIGELNDKKGGGGGQASLQLAQGPHHHSHLQLALQLQQPTTRDSGLRARARLCGQPSPNPGNYRASDISKAISDNCDAADETEETEETIAERTATSITYT